MKSRYAFLENPTEEVHTLCYSLKAYADHGLTYVVWYSDVPSETYQAGLLELVAMAIRHQAGMVLSDGGEFRSLSSATLEWIRTVFLPWAQKNGIKKVARVAYQDSLSYLTNQIYVETVRKMASHTPMFEFEAFTDFDQAMGWLHHHSHEPA